MAILLADEELEIEADIIVAKHRNGPTDPRTHGPTDPIVLKCQSHYSRFFGMAQ
ncbi:hypothetical protein ACTXKZ_07615 [Brachybacterium alimentarium]|uniref:hypothetical protein n=1 Tax=Brachybacterium alimentarium TaxID=47845 RepID=UPI003FCF80EF